MAFTINSFLPFDSAPILAIHRRAVYDLGNKGSGTDVGVALFPIFAARYSRRQFLRVNG